MHWGGGLLASFHAARLFETTRRPLPHVACVSKSLGTRRWLYCVEFCGETLEFFSARHVGGDALADKPATKLEGKKAGPPQNQHGEPCCCQRSGSRYCKAAHKSCTVPTWLIEVRFPALSKVNTVRPVRRATDGRPAASVTSGGKLKIIPGPMSISWSAEKLIFPGPLTFTFRVFAESLRFVSVRKRGAAIISELVNSMILSPLGRFGCGAAKAAS